MADTCAQISFLPESRNSVQQKNCRCYTKKILLVIFNGYVIHLLGTLIQDVEVNGIGMGIIYKELRAVRFWLFWG